jgi:hypothetical protein
MKIFEVTRATIRRKTLSRSALYAMQSYIATERFYPASMLPIQFSLIARQISNDLDLCGLSGNSFARNSGERGYHSCFPLQAKS